MATTYTEIGRILKTHGYAGEVRVHIENPYLEFLADSEVLFIGEQEAPLPYFLEYIRWDTNPMIVKFEDLDSKETAKDIISRPCFLATDTLATIEDHPEESDLQYLFAEGYEILTTSGNRIGRIIRVDQYPQQEMALVQFEEEERLIPLNDNFIKEIDREGKRLIMAIPEGLLNL